MQELVQHIPSQPRVTAGPFQFAIDHCFSIKGQGTVMTGTVLAGQVKVNDSIELPELKVRLPVVPQPLQITCSRCLARGVEYCQELSGPPGT